MSYHCHLLTYKCCLLHLLPRLLVVCASNLCQMGRRAWPTLGAAARWGLLSMLALMLTRESRAQAPPCSVGAVLQTALQGQP